MQLLHGGRSRIDAGDNAWYGTYAANHYGEHDLYGRNGEFAGLHGLD